MPAGTDDSDETSGRRRPRTAFPKDGGTQIGYRCSAGTCLLRQRPDAGTNAKRPFRNVKGGKAVSAPPLLSVKKEIFGVRFMRRFKRRPEKGTFSQRVTNRIRSKPLSDFVGKLKKEKSCFSFSPSLSYGLQHFTPLPSGGAATRSCPPRCGKCPSGRSQAPR